MLKSLFRKKSRIALSRLPMNQLVVYRKEERAALLHTGYAEMRFRSRRLLHPFLLVALHVYHALKRIHITVNGEVPKTKGPIIFSVSHIGMYDVEVVLQAIRKHAHILSADEEYMYRTFDGWFFDANGVIYVDPNDREDKRVALQTAIEFLKRGESLFWTPEGIWNLSPNQVVLPIHYGIIQAAVSAHAVIVPIGLEQYDRKYGIDFVVNIGNAWAPHVQGELTKQIKIQLSETLRSHMARLKFDAWEHADRAAIPPGYYASFVKKRLAEWPHYTMQIIRNREFDPSGHVTAEEAFSHLNHIKIGPHNAFLARVQFKYIQEQRWAATAL